MPQPSPSNAENDYRNPLDAFTDREAILALFEQTLRSARAGQLHLLAVKGNSGTGKTFLVSYLTERVCPRFQWQCGQMRFAQSVPDFRTILLGLEDALKGGVPSARLEHYRAARDEYIRRFDEYKTAINIGSIQQHMVASGEQSSIATSPQSIQINTQLHERELHLRSELTRALLELAEAVQQSLCLFIDGYERLTALDSELVGWLWEEVLPGLARAIPHPFLVMTCGWEWPNDAAISLFMRRAELNDFDMEQVKSYLKKLEVITYDIEPSPPQHEELVNAFYELTQGHPLVLGLAVTYFNELGSDVRTAESLRTNRPLLDEMARTQFLEERLLWRLPEPHRTLLDRGPILRSFDMDALQALLEVDTNGERNEKSKLDDDAYDRFLKYPFVNCRSIVGSSSLMVQPTFHSLIRRVRLGALRLHPQKKVQLHRKMVDYYKQIAEAEQRRDTTHGKDDFKADYPEVLEKGFKSELEKLYHALQVEEFQVNAFKEWEVLTEQAVNQLRRWQVGPLLGLVLQLEEEGEPFLSKTSNSYGRYLRWYSNSLAQEFRWEEARAHLEEAVKIFKQVGNLPDLAICFGSIGYIFHFQGNMQQALSYYEQALSLTEQVGNPAATLQLLGNIGFLYYQQGKLEQAVLYYERALPPSKQMGNLAATAQLLSIIGFLYFQQRKLEQALDYYKQALPLSKQVGNPDATAQLLSTIGDIYSQQGKLEQALSSLEQALDYYKQVGDPAVIAQLLNDLGSHYYEQGKLEQALDYLEQALPLSEQIGNPAATAQLLSTIGDIYSQQGKLEQALSSLERALPLSEKLGNPEVTAQFLNNIGFLYSQQGKLKLAIERYTKALSLYESLGPNFVSEVADQLEDLATCYTELGDFKKSIDYETRVRYIRENIQKTS